MTITFGEAIRRAREEVPRSGMIEALIDVAEAASILWKDMPAYDYEPQYSALETKVDAFREIMTRKVFQ